MNLDSALQTFFEESRELLSAMEDALLTLENTPGDTDAINAVFRAMHTIKGSAGLFGLDAIVSFTHVAESVMDKVRSGELTVDEKLTALLLGCQDHIGSMVDDLAAGADTPDPAQTESGKGLVSGLRGYLDRQPGAAPAEAPAAPLPSVVESAGVPVENDSWHISVRFSPDLMRNGYDPLSFVRYLGTLGTLAHVETISDTMPAAEAMDPETCYLGFEIRLASAAEKAAIEAAFDFVRDDCSLTILPPHSQVGEYIRLIQAQQEHNGRLGEILVDCGALTSKELADGLAAQALEQAARGNAENSVQPLGEILVERAVVQPEVVDAALEKQRQTRESKGHETRALRVDAAKLDELINLVGELVIAGAAATAIAKQGREVTAAAGHQSREGKKSASAHSTKASRSRSAAMAQRNRDMALVEANAAVERLVEAIRDSALRMRMVEIGETFNRFRRVVRDVSQELGKDIELVITGADTELDKSVVEKIGDPLMHLVRNAMDHGIESAEVRVRNGKPAQGTLRLNAYHDSGSIVIEIIDDGGGLSRDRILAKALERGLVQPGQNLSDQEIYNLIFEAGFSTAEQVTNLSGRGVGMDVVRRNIDALRGTVSLDSRPGAGTTVSIRLPLTLAIINGFLVGVGEAAYIIPLDSVAECTEIDPAETASHEFLNLRGEVLPFLRLREMFEVPGEPARRQNLVVIQYAGQKAGLVVDRLIGEFQTVIKPLGQLFRHLRGFAGSTILGSGEVALILDVQDLIRVAAQREGMSGNAETVHHAKQL